MVINVLGQHWYCYSCVENHSPSWNRWLQKKMYMPKLTEEIIYCREKFASTWQILHFLFTLRKTSFESTCLHLRLKLHNAISITHLCIFLCTCHLRHWAYIWVALRSHYIRTILSRNNFGWISHNMYFKDFLKNRIS